jgi:hypothetical protein
LWANFVQVAEGLFCAIYAPLRTGSIVRGGISYSFLYGGVQSRGRVFVTRVQLTNFFSENF